MSASAAVPVFAPAAVSRFWAAGSREYNTVRVDTPACTGVRVSTHARRCVSAREHAGGRVRAAGQPGTWASGEGAGGGGPCAWTVDARVCMRVLPAVSCFWAAGSRECNTVRVALACTGARVMGGRGVRADTRVWTRPRVDLGHRHLLCVVRPRAHACANASHGSSATRRVLRAECYTGFNLVQNACMRTREVVQYKVR
jgi:hypothetical protein